MEALSHHLLTGRVRSCGCLITTTNRRPELAGRNAAIRQAHEQGRSYASIAAEFGLAPESVRRICQGKGP